MKKRKIILSPMRMILLFVFTIWSFVSVAQGVDVLHYDFTIDLREEHDSITGRAKIKFIQLGKDGLVKLDLTSAKRNGKGMKIQTAALIHPTYSVLTYKQSGEKVEFKTPRLKKGDTAEIEMIYSGIPADGLIISRNKFGDRTWFSDNWPNRAHHWIPCNDRPDDKATVTFRVGAPKEYSVISNGVRESPGLPGKPYRQSIWNEKIPIPTKIMVIGVAKFAVKEYADSPQNIPVTAWIYEKDSANGFKDYSPAPEILKFFSNYIAPYPFEKLANVQSTTIFGGMENASAIFYNESSVTGKGNIEPLLAHEIVHQWFGDMASEKSFTHLWLSEGFATYLTNIYLEQKYGEVKLLERLEKDRKEIIEFVKNSNRAVVDSLTPYMDLLNANSYQKGGWILHMLRNEVGDRTFQKIIQAYYQQFKGGNADSRDFEAVAEKVSGQELTWFFDQWLYRPGIPVLEMETKLQDGEFYLYVTQKTTPYRFNLEISIADEDGMVTDERFLVTEKESEFKVKVKGTKISFSIDPHVKLLYVLKE